MLQCLLLLFCRAHCHVAIKMSKKFLIAAGHLHTFDGEQQFFDLMMCQDVEMTKKFCLKRTVHVHFGQCKRQANFFIIMRTAKPVHLGFVHLSKIVQMLQWISKHKKICCAHPSIKNLTNIIVCCPLQLALTKNVRI